jgi:hypothetical protein
MVAMALGAIATKLRGVESLWARAYTIQLTQQRMVGMAPSGMQSGYGSVTLTYTTR